MKSLFHTQTLIALAVAIAATTGFSARAQDQPAPPPAGDAALPPEIAPNTPLAQVIKLVQAGVDLSTINNFIASSASPFDLDADKIMTLNDLGVPKDVINAMLNRDKALYAAAAMPAPSPAQPAPTDTPPPDTTDTAPPTAPVTVEYFDTSLNPYGSWVVVEGYGRCWRPTTVIYDSGWRPYCDRGHWVNTDCGWYWDSDYSWGVTFHYGRWFRDGRFGWCWYPDTQWAPSWVTWRSSDAYCGWAPLPPLAVYRPGAGFFYRGASVTADFSFGLGADYFTFVTPDHFLEHHPRRFSVDAQHAPQIFNRTTIINNFNNHDRFVVNNGIPVAQVSARAHRPIPTVQVGALPDANRQGWRGPSAAPAPGANHPANHAPAGNNNNYNNNPVRSPGGGQINQNHNPAVHESNNNGNNGNNGNNPYSRYQGTSPAAQSHIANPQTSSPYLAPRQELQTQTSPNNRNNLIINGNQPDNRPRTFQQQTPPVQHTTPAAETHQYTAPERTEQRAPQVEQHVETAPTHAETVQHSSPPPAQSQPAHAQSESHNQQGQQGGSGKDQKN